MTETTIHDLKIEPQWLDEVAKFHKTFEVRRDDRGFEPDDWLRMTDPDGRTVYVQIVNVHRGLPGIKPGYAVLSLAPYTHTVDPTGGISQMGATDGHV